MMEIEEGESDSLLNPPSESAALGGVAMGGAEGCESTIDQSETIHTIGGGAKLEQEAELPLSASTIGELVRFKPAIGGRQVPIATNPVDLQFVYRYDVTIEPQSRSTEMLKEAIELFQRVYFPEYHPCFDGWKILYSPKRLPLKDDTIRVTVSHKSQQFKITVKLTQTFDLSPFKNFPNTNYSYQGEEVFRCMGLVLRQVYSDSFMNQPLVVSTNNQSVSPLEAPPKLIQSWNPLPSFNAAQNVYTSAILITDLLIQLFSTENKSLTHQDLKTYRFERWQVMRTNEYLAGLRICYELPKPPNFKIYYRINKLANPSDQESFLFRDHYVTVEQFYKLRWRLQLEYPNLPTLWVGHKTRKICVPMELCTLKEGQLVSNVHTNTPMTTNLQRILEDVSNVADSKNNSSVEEFGLSVDPPLDPATVGYSDGELEPIRGNWWSKKFEKGAVIQNWTILAFGVDSPNLDKTMETFAETIQTYGNLSGMLFAEPTKPFGHVPNQKLQLVAYLEEKKHYDLIMVVIPNKTDSYFLVKQQAEQTVGVLTQCMRMQTLCHMNEATIRNLLLKINSKLNGTSHVVGNLDLINDEACMVMGAEANINAANLPTVVAVTASYDSTATNYSTCVYLQPPNIYPILNLEAITLAKIQMIVEKTGTEPQRIYFFRQGLIEGQFERVSRLEVVAIKKACDAFRPGYNPAVTYIAVLKRHLTRSRPTDETSGPVGAGVDPNVRNVHLCLRGVGRPSRYWVLYDENRMSHDDVEVLAYYLCYVYGGCNKAVRYPAPTYFAHLAAERARGYLHDKHIDLQNPDQSLVAIDREFAAKSPMFFA